MLCEQKIPIFHWTYLVCWQSHLASGNDDSGA